VRGTIDIDVYRAADREVAEAELRRAAVDNIGDWFRFALGPSRPIADAGASVRIPVVATIGRRHGRSSTWTSSERTSG